MRLPTLRKALCMRKRVLRRCGDLSFMISRIPNIIARYDASAVVTTGHVDKGDSPGI
jgi:hypothetical protein